LKITLLPLKNLFIKFFCIDSGTPAKGLPSLYYKELEKHINSLSKKFREKSVIKQIVIDDLKNIKFIEACKHYVRASTKRHSKPGGYTN
jgi:hypothetical protein